jgi:glyoxylase-like metal-dependent hydrolase (beta-lactamase superfamily II)
MNRRSFLQNTALTLGELSITQQKIFASLFSKTPTSAPPPWMFHMMTDKIGVFTERGGTIGFLLEQKGVVVVDAQFPDTAPHLIGEVQKNSDASIKYLINTHHHGDHTAGNIAFKGLVKNVVAHENSKKNQKRVAKANKTEDRQLYPDRTFSDYWQKHVGDESIALYYFGPAHTNGDAIIHFENSNIVHMGDLMFNRRHPFVDRSAGASIKGWIKVLNKTIRRFDNKTTYIFGHAADGYNIVGNADDLKKFADYLDGILRFTESEIAGGKTKEGFLLTKNLPFATEWKGDGLARPLTAAWEELTEKK